MSWYCEAAKDNPIHESYHDTEYGFPLIGKDDERYLFELQSLELFQAGLSWELILKNAQLPSPLSIILMSIPSPPMVRKTRPACCRRGHYPQQLKVASIIENANRIQALRGSHDGFANWIAAHHPLNRDDWTKLFRSTFKFMGGEIVNEFLMCIGNLPGSHHADCTAYKRIAKMNPPWMQVDAKVSGLLVEAKAANAYSLRNSIPGLKESSSMRLSRFSCRP